MGRVPLPKPSLLDTFTHLGYIYGERRWRDADGFLYTWDSLHGEIEVFSPRGRRRGAIDPLDGSWLKLARQGRRIRV